MKKRTFGVIALTVVTLSGVAVCDDLPKAGDKCLGAKLAWVNAPEVKELFKKLDAPRPPGRGGIIILDVESVGTLSALQPGDVITSIEGKPLINEAESFELLNSLAFGEHEVGILRGQVTKRGKKEWERIAMTLHIRTYKEHLMACMKSKTDQFTSSEFMSHIGSSDRAFNPTGITLRLVKKNGNWSPIFDLNLANEDTLFLNSFYVLVDDESTKFAEPECDVKREYRGRLTFEWAILSGKKVENVTDKLRSAKKVAIRFVGDNLSIDHQCSEEELERLIIAARAYAMLEPG